MYNGRKSFSASQQKNPPYTQTVAYSCAHNSNFHLSPIRRYCKYLKKDYRKILRMYNEVCHKKTDFPMIYDLFAKNFYLVRSAYKACLRELCTTSKVSFCGNTPSVVAAFSSFFQRTRTPLNKERFEAVLTKLDSDYEMPLFELFLLPTLVNISILSAFASLSDDCPDSSFPEKFTIYTDFTNIFTSLKFSAIHNFNIYILNGKCAKILSNDPAEAFNKMTEKSKIMYLKILSKKAKRLAMTDVQYAKHLIKEAEKGNSERTRHVGYNLLSEPSFLSKILFFLSVAIPFVTVLSLIPLSPLFLLSFIPLYKATTLFVDCIYQRKQECFFIPAMEVSQIPTHSAVLVVITSLLCGENHDSEIFDKLENIYNANGNDNIYFGVLADIRESKTAKAPGDEETLSYAYGRTEALCHKYGRHFILFERCRSYSKREELFMGSAGKRGAITELVSFLKGKDSTFTDKSKSLASEILSGTRIKYVITLEPDTEVGIDTVKNLYGKMIHPLSKPYYDSKKSAIISGYGIIIPSYSSYTSSFSKDIYCQTIFDGNGILDVDAFYNTIIKHNVFSPESVSDYGRITASKLNCTVSPVTKIAKPFPGNQPEFFESLGRHIRKNISELFFVLFHGTKQNISVFLRLSILANVLYDIAPIFSFWCIFCAMITDNPVKSLLVVSALLYTAVPFAFSFFRSLPNFSVLAFTRRFFSGGITTSIRRDFLLMLFTLSSIPSFALHSSEAFIKAVYRNLITKRNLLERKVHGESDGDTGLLLYVRKNIICAFSGFLLFAFVQSGFLKFIAILWFAFPVVSYLISQKNCEECENNYDTFKEVSDYAKKISKEFFCSFKKDNLCISSEAFNSILRDIRLCKASPVDAGMCLLSLLCAVDFGFADVSELKSNLMLFISEIKNAKKYKGHLLQKHTETNGNFEYYISSSGSAVFSACLITLRCGLTDYVSESTELLEVIKLIKELEEEIDYTFLYNPDIQLFYVGAYITQEHKICIMPEYHTHMMSVSKLLSFIQCAKRKVPKAHFEKLIVPIISSGGYLGIASSSGNMEDYFLPHIFLPLFNRSIHWEAANFALKQYCNSSNEITEKENMIMPNLAYIFAHQYNKGESITKKSTLIFNKESNGRGLVSISRYPFCALCALCNAAFNGILVKRFMSDDRMRSAESLLKAEIPADSDAEKV